MKKRIKLAFSDFWRGFDPKQNLFIELLSEKYDIELSDSPDFLLYSVFGKSYKNFTCPRILYCGENISPNFQECDYAMTYDFIDRPEHYRLTSLYRTHRAEQLIKKIYNPNEILREKTKFCNFVYSNKHGEKRNSFFRKLSEYKQVDSGGRWLNNIGAPVKDKLKFIKNYKFTISFENSSRPGYTTEKLVEPMVVNSLPIYWGNPKVDLDFNSRSFINWYDYGSDEKVIERIIEIDNDDNLYFEYLREPWLPDNVVPFSATPAALLKWFEYIFEDAESLSKIKLVRRLLGSWGYKFKRLIPRF